MSQVHIRQVTIVVLVLLILFSLSLWLNPLARVDLFARFGLGEWAFRMLTTLNEKVDITNSFPLDSNDPAWPYVLQPYSGTSLVLYGKEELWAISYEPFVLEVVIGDETYSLERIGKNTLIYQSQEYPLEFTFTRAEPQPHYNDVQVDAVWFYKKARSRSVSPYR